MSQRQREIREKFKQGGSKISQRERSELGKPRSSWWVGLDRSTLNDDAKKEAERMRNSLLGRSMQGNPVD